ncbi:MAG: 50S ribosomal protein L4 [Phototrophicales bacterium]|nr:MAG: 50S ribosomal protein L4 [Phototrophicales bacterium]RMG76537.1 MAG: 50S ribosomal protein L4 [Chloroflexota bacterium]
MQVSVLDINGKEVSQVDLPADIFEVEVNTGLMHQAYVRQMANARLGTHKTKTRSEVRMTTAKWYRQKGTGRARHGAKSAPIFVGGGIAHGPRPRKYTKNMPKKMRRQAIRCALSALLRDNQLVVVDQFNVSSHKTKDMMDTLEKLVGDQSALVLLADRNDNVERSIRNIPNAMYLRANYLNIRDLLKHDKVIMPLDALEVIKRIWGREE